MIRKSISIFQFFAFMLLLILIPLTKDSRAAITLIGDVTPGIVTSDPWNVNNLIVGDEGDGTVSILGGSDVQVAQNVFLAYMGGANGIVTINGLGSQLDAGGPIFTGAWGIGTMTISGSGAVTSDATIIGGFDPRFDTLAEYFDPEADLGGGTGTAIVTGAGSSWQTESMMVGFSGQGTLQILNGGQVQNQSAWVGVVPDANGTVEVSDSNSMWTNAADLAVGVWGDGTVMIKNGGKASAETAYIGGVPSSLIDMPDANDYPTDGTGTVTVTGANSSLTVTGAETLVVGGWGNGTLDVNDGGTVTSDNTSIGGYDPMFHSLEEYFDPNADLGGGTGTVLVTGEGSTLNTGDLSVGFSGEGTLEIGDGAEVTASNTWLGSMPDAVGILDVNGPGSLLTNAGELVVGAWGQGDATIQNGGRVNATEAFIGGVSFDLLETPYDPNLIPDGTGTVTVTGEGSTLDITGATSLYVGYFGDGTLDVNDGGHTMSDLSVLGAAPDAVGTVTVQDPNSIWSASEMVVGAWGEGNLTISNGGQVTAQTAWIGGFEVNEADFDPNMLADFGDVHGVGTVTVTGEGSTFTVTGDETLKVGPVGTGTLTVQNGADVNSVESFVGGYVSFEDSNGTEVATIHGGGTGTATVTGNGSIWQNEFLTVGAGGTGTLMVSNGGAVTDNVGIVGLGPDSVGTATVTGAGSIWSSVDANDPNESSLDGTLIIGAWGEGHLTVADGGDVNAVDLYIGGMKLNELGTGTDWGLDDPNGTGTVTVTGEGSTLNVTSDNSLYVGYFGDGTLDVNDAGQVSSESAGIAVIPDSIGTATVDGNDSTWSNSGSLFVGGYGTGTLTVSGGGETTIGDTLFIGGFDANAFDVNTTDVGYDPNGTGTVTVTGTGSILQVLPADQGDNTTYVGYSGTGTLNILNGGEVQTDAMIVGALEDSNGLVTVDGTGSTLQITGVHSHNLQANGDGEVIVSNGGQVIVDDPNALLNVGGTLTVGSVGTNNSLTISDGGLVRSDSGVIGGYDPEFPSLGQYFDPDANLSDGTGTATVTGAGSRWETDSLMVGFSGVGTLNITGGGRVVDGMGMIGVIPGGVGTAEVNGSGSLWNNTDNLVVGAWGQGDLTISNGGQVTTPDMYIGGMPFNVIEENYDPNHLPTGTGTVTVTGEGSNLDVMNLLSLYVGYFGDGTLDVNDGGDVTSNSAGIGVMPDSVGTATVDGNGSTWTNTNNMFVGGYGTGTLTISNGGHATVEETLFIGGFDTEIFDVNTSNVGYGPNGTGTVTVTGEGSELINAPLGNDTIKVGYSGNGTLNILDGGVVQTDAAVVGELEGSKGLLTVDGTGSTLQINGINTHSVVGEGDGEVIISNGGQIDVNDPNGLLYVGYNGDFGSGTLTVGSVGENSTLTVSNGGVVDSYQGVIGGYDPHYSTVGEYLDPNTNLDTGSGTATVTGGGSFWSATHIEVGFSGPGTLSINNGGRVTDTSAFIGAAPDVNGIAVVSGSGSLWNNYSDLVIGGWGNGTLNVLQGGQVFSDNAYLGGMPSDVIWTDFDPNYIPMGTGITTVNGPGSLWENDNLITVGTYGGGLLTISNGGELIPASPGTF